MNTPVNVGLAGCGRIARMFHAPVLRDMPGVRLAAAADPDLAARQAALAGAPGAIGVADVEELLAVPGLDAVVVALPTHLHAEAAVAAFEAGKHVYLEKPLATDLAEGARIDRAWRAAHRRGAVGFNFRFHPLHRAAGRAVRRGELGEVVALRAVFSSAPRAVPEWKRDRATGGGALLDLASHQIDTVRHLLSAEVEAVSASIRSRLGPQDTAALTLHLSTGVVAQLLATTSAAASDRLEILGTTATLQADRMGRRRVSIVPAAGGSGPAEVGRVLAEGVRSTVDRLRPPPEQSFAAALTAFAEDLASGAEPEPGSPASHLATIEDGLRSLAVIEAAERSVETGTIVAVKAPAAEPA